MYPVKDATESNTSASYLDLLLSIGRNGQLCTSLHNKRDDFNLHITIFPFLSSNIPFYQPMAFLSHTSYGISGFVPLMNVLFFGRRDFHLSFSDRGMSGNIWNCLRKFYGRYGNLIKHSEVSLIQMLRDILGHDHIQWHLQLIRHYTNLWTYFRTWSYYWFWPYNQISWGFHRTLQRKWLANRGRLLLRTPGPVPFRTCIYSVETIFSWPCHVFGLWISNIPRYFCLAFLEALDFWIRQTVVMIAICNFYTRTYCTRFLENISQ